MGNRFVVRISPGKLSLKGDCRSSVKSARDEKLVLTENIVRGHVKEVIGDSLCGMCGKENQGCSRHSRNQRSVLHISHKPGTVGAHEAAR